LVLDVKVEENKKTSDLLSLPIRCVCGISHAGVNYSTIPAVNLGVLYFRIFLRKLYLLYIGTEEVKVFLQPVMGSTLYIYQNILYLLIPYIWELSPNCHIDARGGRREREEGDKDEDKQTLQQKLLVAALL
jgi:hypothetical protein